jgi:outer membrane protein OmpA-like peptidoglycan-associated protein
MRYTKYILKLVFICLFAITTANAQNSNTKSADKLYEQFDFINAVKLYEKAVKKDPTDTKSIQKIADCYRFMNNPQMAEIWYGQLINNTSADPINKFYYAQALRNNGKYDEAKQYYADYSKVAGTDKRSIEILKGIELVSLLGKDNPLYEVSICPFNTKYSDYSPYIYKDQVLFVSNGISTGQIDPWTQRPFSQLYSVTSDSVNIGNYSKPEMFLGNTINGKYHEGPIALDRALNDLYITRNNYTSKFVRSNDKSVKLKIFRLSYVPSLNKFGTKLIQDFPHNSDQYSCAHPTISRDGQELYFTSDMPGGMGGTDIYVCKKEGPIWGAPQNLKEINTAGRDGFPFIADDGTLYFASDGHFGLGGLDIYYIRKEGAKWSRIANIGAPLNSSNDDFGYVQNEFGSKGYFTSNRSGGIGDDDIYSFTKEGLNLCGEVIDALTSAKLPGAIVKLFEGNILKNEVEADSKGGFCFEVEPFKKYRVVASKQDYIAKDLIVDVKTEKQFIQLPLKKQYGIRLDVFVIDAKTKAPINMADVKLISLKTNQEAPKVTNSAGHVLYDLDSETEYKVIAEKDLPAEEAKYLANSTLFNTKGVKSPAELNITIELRKEYLNKFVKIENIYYDLDKYFIRPDATIELDKIVKILKDNPTMEIELSSHTDCRSSSKYNMWLSAKRAEAAVNYLIKQGVNPYRLIAAGYGETRVINGCNCEPDNNSPCSEAQHQENRRTEFKIFRF